MLFLYTDKLKHRRDQSLSKWLVIGTELDLSENVKSCTGSALAKLSNINRNIYLMVFVPGFVCIWYAMGVLACASDRNHTLFLPFTGLKASYTIQNHFAYWDRCFPGSMWFDASTCCSTPLLLHRMSKKSSNLYAASLCSHLRTHFDFFQTTRWRP